MRVLLDTCVLSELRHPKGDAGVRRAVDALDSESLFVSVLSIGKESQNKRALQTWLQTLEHSYGDRLLPVDLRNQPHLGRTHGRRPESGANRAGQ